MAHELAAIERETIQRELRQIFDEPTVEVLGQILGRMAARAEELRVTRDEFQALRATVEDLALAQRRTDRAVQRLAEAQQRAEERLSRLEETVQRLVEAQQRTEATVAGLVEAQQRAEERLSRLEETVQRLEERLSRLEETVQRLVEAQQRAEERLSRLEETVQRLAEAQQRTEEELRQLAEAQRYMAHDLARIRGDHLELVYERKAYAYFGPLLRRVRAVSPVELEDEMEARLAAWEFRDWLRLDLLIHGRPRHLEEAPEIWLAVEVSAVVDSHDVDRALQRADYMRRAGYLAIPTVAGERLTKGAEKAIEMHHVLAVTDGKIMRWEEALSEALAWQRASQHSQ